MSRKISEFFESKPKSKSGEGNKVIVTPKRNQDCQVFKLNSKVNKAYNQSKIINGIKNDQEEEFVIKVSAKLTPTFQNLNPKFENDNKNATTLIDKPAKLTSRFESKTVQKSPKEFQIPRKVYSKFSNFPKISNIESKNDSECKYCGKQFPDSSYIYDHVKRVHIDKVKDLLHNCKICGIKFFRRRWLERHMEAKHSDGKIVTFICDIDGKTFTNKKYLRCHMMQHYQKVNCKICNAKLAVLCLNHHMNIAHRSGFGIQCKTCGKSLTNAANLKRHEKIHDKKFECKICKKKFTHEREVKRHQKHFHEELKTETCEFCGKKFADKFNLRQHLKVHDKNRPKPFKCQKCDHATDTKQRFEKHLRSHERNEKRFAAMKRPEKCNKCPMLCKNKTALKFHLSNVHSTDVHQCDLCGNYFKNRNIMLGHLKYFHLRIRNHGKELK